MRLTTPFTWLVALCLLAAPMTAAAQPARDAPAQSEKVRRPASADELGRYAEREKQAQGLEKFEGGRRGGGTDITLIIIVLLVVILVLILI